MLTLLLQGDHSAWARGSQRTGKGLTAHRLIVGTLKLQGPHRACHGVHAYVWAHQDFDIEEVRAKVGEKEEQAPHLKITECKKTAPGGEHTDQKLEQSGTQHADAQGRPTRKMKHRGKVPDPGTGGGHTIPKKVGTHGGWCRFPHDNPKLGPCTLHHS